VKRGNVKILTWLLWGGIGLFLGVQFFRPQKNIQNNISKTDIRNVIPTSNEVINILDRACNDCHSDNTRYPWYAEIMPLGWWIDRHIKDGKRHLNFSISATYSVKKLDHKLEEIEEEINKENMPPSNYTIIHKNAKLTNEDKNNLLEWIRNGRLYLSEKVNSAEL
jgi:hypothetical protein